MSEEKVGPGASGDSSGLRNLTALFYLVLGLVICWPFVCNQWAAFSLNRQQQAAAGAHRTRALELEQKGQTVLALVAVQQAARAQSSVPETEVQLVRLQLRDLAERPGTLTAARLDEADYLLLWAEQEGIGDAWLRKMVRANVLAARGETRAALEQLREVAQGQPKLVLPRFLLGDLLRSQGKLDDAELELRQALELDANHQATRLALGSVLLQNKKADQASAILEPLLALPAQALAQGMYGIALAQQNKHEAALEPLSQAWQANPQQPEVARHLGMVLLRLKRSGEAISILRAALQLRPDDDTLYQLGLAYRLSGRVQEALETFRTLLRQQPDQLAVRREIGACLEEAGAPEQALGVYRELERLAIRQKAGEEFLAQVRQRIAALQQPAASAPAPATPYATPAR